MCRGGFSEVMPSPSCRVVRGPQELLVLLHRRALSTCMIVLWCLHKLQDWLTDWLLMVLYSIINKSHIDGRDISDVYSVSLLSHIYMPASLLDHSNRVISMFTWSDWAVEVLCYQNSLPKGDFRFAPVRAWFSNAGGRGFNASQVKAITFEVDACCMCH